MKTFAIWFVLNALAMVGAGATFTTMHAYRVADGDPEKIGIAVDASFEMKDAWPSVPKILESIARDHPQATFLVVTEPGRIRQWMRRPALDGTRPFAPRRLDKLIAMPVWEEADKVYMITNAGVVETPSGWELKQAR